MDSTALDSPRIYKPLALVTSCFHFSYGIFSLQSLQTSHISPFTLLAIGFRLC
jgi:hypothetical protein